MSAEDVLTSWCQNPIRAWGTICHNVPIPSTQRRGQPATVTTMGRGTKVQKSLDSPQAGRARSKPPSPTRFTKGLALMEARMVFSGRSQCRDPPPQKKGLLTSATLFISLDSLKPREISLSFAYIFYTKYVGIFQA